MSTFVQRSNVEVTVVFLRAFFLDLLRIHLLPNNCVCIYNSLLLANYILGV